MDCSPDLVAVKVAEVEALGHDPLTGEGGVAVDQDRDDLLAVDGVLKDALAGAGLAENDGIDRLEVAGVGGEVDLGLLPLLVAAGGLVTKVILHVAAGVAKFGIVFVTELVEDDGKGLLEEVGQDVEAASMGHAKH